MIGTVGDVKATSRRDKARRTRLRIIKAAHAEFLENGYHGATMAAIARRAGVAAQTVYFVFHTKPELISAVIDTAVLGEDDPTRPEDSDWWAAMRAAATAPDALRLFARGAGPLFARAAGISEILRAAAFTDDELSSIQRRHDELQTRGYRQVVEITADKQPLRPGLTTDTATDLLLLICGDHTYVSLTQRGWTHDEVVDWLSETVPSLLLATDPEP